MRKQLNKKIKKGDTKKSNLIVKVKQGSKKKETRGVVIGAEDESCLTRLSL